MSDTAGSVKKVAEAVIKVEYDESTDNRKFKKVETTAKIVNNALIYLAKGIDKTTLDIGKSVANIVSSLSSSASAISKITSEELSSFKTNLGKVNDVVTDFIKDASKNVDEDAIALVNKQSRAIDSVARNQRFFTKQTDEDRRSANSNLSNTVLGFGSTLSYFGTSHSKETLDIFSKFISKLDKFTDIIQFFSEMDNGSLNRSFDILHKANEEALAKEISHLKEIEKHKDRMYEKELAQGAAKQKKKEEYAQRNFEQSLKFNEQTHQLALARRTKWFEELMGKGLKSALFGEEDPETGKKKSGTGLLGGDIKAALLNGIKGAFIGAIVGMIFKVLGMVKKILLAPLNVAKKLATTVFGFLRKSLNGAETFKKLIELVMLPFTLLFTLLFAPILVKLAPLLVDLVNQVVSKWDVLDQIGEKIAEILTYFFDENQWFSFSNIIDTIIILLDYLSSVALNAFNTAVGAGKQGLEVLVDVAVALIFAITDSIIAFVMSSDCYSLMTSIGYIVGTVLYNGIRAAIYMLVPLFETIGGLFSGLFGAFITDIFNSTTRLIGNLIANKFPTIASIFGISSSSTGADFSATEKEIASLLNTVKSETNQLSNGDTITNMTTSYQTTNYYPSGIGSGTVSLTKGTDMV